LRNRSNPNGATYLPEVVVEASRSELPRLGLPDQRLKAALLIPITCVLSIPYNRHDGDIEPLRDTEYLSILRHEPVPAYASQLLEGVGVRVRSKAYETAPYAPFEILAEIQLLPLEWKMVGSAVVRDDEVGDVEKDVVGHA
jgi:hypothetical protein